MDDKRDLLALHRAGFIGDMEFLNRRSTTIYLVDLELQLPWEDPRFAGCQIPGHRIATGSQDVSRRNLHRGTAFRPPMGLNIHATRSSTTTWPKMEN